MPGKNFGVCHGCRSVGHFFGDCSIKRRCPHCTHGFQKFLKVERDTSNKGKFFKCCSEKCGFWYLGKDGKAIDESNNTGVTLAKPAAHGELDYMSRMFESQVRLNNEEELLISVNMNVTVRRGKPPAEGKTKRKDTT